jgi:hypothetical protein
LADGRAHLVLVLLGGFLAKWVIIGAGQVVLS